MILGAEREIEKTPWTREAGKTHDRTQEADMETSHGIPETHTCLRATEKTTTMIHARNMDKDTFPEKRV